MNGRYSVLMVFVIEIIGVVFELFAVQTDSR